MAQTPKKLILKAGPAPSTPAKDRSANLKNEMPDHSSTKRGKKKVDGDLTGSGQPKKTIRNKSTTSKRGSKNLQIAPDIPGSSKKRNASSAFDQYQPKDALEAMTPQKRQKVEKLLPYVMGFDLGMWGFARAHAPKDTSPALVAASQTWPPTRENNFKAPSVVAFREDNPGQPGYRGNIQELVGFNVKPTMKCSSFFKASLDNRARNNIFDNPILHEPIASVLVNFDTPERDEKAAVAVMKYLYETETKSVRDTLGKALFDQTPLVFVLTHPAAASPEGRQHLEDIARKAGFMDPMRKDQMKLISEAHAAAVSAFTDIKLQMGFDMWIDHFKIGDCVTVLDIGSLTVDTTTEEVKGNDPTLRLREKIASGGGRCGTVTLHLGIIKAIVDKFEIEPSDLTPQIAGRGTEFFNQCEAILDEFGTGDLDDEEPCRFKLALGPETDHEDYDHDEEEVILHSHELQQVLENFSKYPLTILFDQIDAIKKEHDSEVKAVILCGGGSMNPAVHNIIKRRCQDHLWPIPVFRPKNPIAAVCKGAVIGEVSEKLLGERMVTASFGIKYEHNGQVTMHYFISKEDIIDTRKAGKMKGIAGHVPLSIRDVLNKDALHEIDVLVFDRKGSRPSDPDDTRLRVLTSIPVKRRSCSRELIALLEAKLSQMGGAGVEDPNMDAEVNLCIEDSGRLYFEAKHGGYSMGKGLLRIDATRDFDV